MKVTTDLTKFQARSISMWDFDLDEMRKIEPKDEIAKAALNKFINRNGSEIDVHRTNGRRIFNPFTAMKRKHRRFVSFKGEQLIEVDCKNSHPLLMVQKMLKEGFQVEADLVNAVQSGTFYNYLSDGVKTRDEIKEMWFSFCYATTINKNHPAYKTLAKRFPDFMSSFAYYVADKNLSEYLQMIESEVWIDKISTALMRAELPHVTIHDSVVFPGIENLNKVLDIVQLAFGKIDPPLHVEYLGGDKIEFKRVPDLAQNSKYLDHDTMMMERIIANEIDENTILNKDEPVIYIDGKVAMSRNNISTIVGKPKAGKGTFLSLICNGMINGHRGDMFSTSLSYDQRNIVVIDTEQSRWDTQGIIRKVGAMGGVHGRIKAYSLRGFDSAELREALRILVQAKYKTTPLFIVDGVRELAEKGVNDQEESISIYRQLIALAGEFSVHIILFIHENKADDNATGFLGGDLIKKGEISFNVYKDKKARIHRAEPKYERHEPLDDIFFNISVDNEMSEPIPVITDEPPESEIKITDVRQITDYDYETALRTIFANGEISTKTALCDKLGMMLGLAEKKSKYAVEYCELRGWISSRKGDKNRSIYSLNSDEYPNF